MSPRPIIQAIPFLRQPSSFPPSVTQLQAALSRGETSSEALVHAALARIAKPAGEGPRAFTEVHAQAAMDAARASDRLRARQGPRSLLEGLPLSVKDLFDIQGSVTTAGSRVLANQPAAGQTAPAVQRLLAAGAINVGRTHMTEFAFSGLGLNAHHDTPAAPWDREHRRIPGGSSSGAGVAVADGMSVVSLGTDTGGSIRVPAAFCGVTGFKPTARRVPAGGLVPLSPLLDSVGPLAPTVRCCAIADAILAGVAPRPPAAPPAHLLRLAFARDFVLDGADDVVRAAFEHGLDVLRAAGARIDTLSIPEFGQLDYIHRRGSLVSAHAWQWHQPHLQRAADDYSPWVRSRILRGRNMDAHDYQALCKARREWIAAVETRLRGYDALLMPTVPIVAPEIARMQNCPDESQVANALVLRNTSLINFLDGCALSIPCHPRDTAPVGLMVAGPALRDAAILDIGLTVEQLLHEARG